MQELVWGDWTCVQLASSHVEVLVTIDVGPRIVSFSTPEGPNCLATLPDLDVDTEAGVYHMRGGHRLWHAPEIMPRTYVPDDLPVEYVRTQDGHQFTQPIEKETGIQKQLILALDETRAKLTIWHVLYNRGPWPIHMAPWALTMLPLGGVALLPLTSDRIETLQPDRHLALWPYTQLDDPRLQLRDSLILVKGEGGRRLKVGFANHRGWMGYWRPHGIFVKQAPYFEGGYYPDLNSSSECFVAEKFLELETLGPLQSVRPGESIRHKEVWSLLEISTPDPTRVSDFRQVMETVEAHLSGE